MVSDPQFWVAIAFIIFLLAIFNPVRKILSSSLDTKISEIKNSLEEAENLKNETQEILSNIKRRQNEVEIEIREIHTSSKERIKVLELQSQKKLKELIGKRELLAAAKIDQMGRDAKLQIQQNISQIAIEATVAVLEKKLSENEKQDLIDQSIKDIGSVLKN